MPFVEHRGQRIHHEIRGDGPTVVLLHSLFTRGSRWELNGYVDALASDHRVVTIDSLGHGDSDKPHDSALYSRAQRAGDVAAVLDAVRADRAHLVGYSMGAWTATGVAIHYPERLASITLGGWDASGGVAHGGGVASSFDFVLAAARARVPEVVAWVAADVEPALCACFRALSEFDGAEAALAALHCPVLLWSGDEDACRGAMKALADARGFSFLSTRGDHATAMTSEVAFVVARLREHFRAGAVRPSPSSL